MMLVCRVEPLLGDSDRARGGGLDGCGSGSRCLYVRVRNGNAVSMQGRASQRQTGRSGLAATLFWACRWPVCVSLCVGWDRARAEARAHISCMNGKAVLCLALGSPNDKLLCETTQYKVRRCCLSFSSPPAGGNSGRVERGEIVACSVGRGSFDPLSMGVRRRVLRPSWAGGPAFLVFVRTAVVVPWSFPSQPRAKPSWGSS